MFVYYFVELIVILTLSLFLSQPSYLSLSSLSRWGKTNGIPNEAINHSPHAIAVAQYTANFFVQEARKNFHTYATPAKEDAALIDNYPPSKTTGSFMETYFFHF